MKPFEAILKKFEAMLMRLEAILNHFEAILKEFHSIVHLIMSHSLDQAKPLFNAGKISIFQPSAKLVLRRKSLKEMHLNAIALKLWAHVVDKT